MKNSIEFIPLISKINSLKSHAGFKKYFLNTSWLFAEQGLRIVSGLFVGVWVARYLGPEQFGEFSYAVAFTAIFAGIAKLGLDGIIVRELVNHPEEREQYIGTAFWLKVIGWVLVIGLISSILPFTANNPSTKLFIFIIAGGLLFQSFEVVEFYFQSQVLARIISICKFIQLAFSSLIRIYLVLKEAELLWFVLVVAFDAFSLAVSFLIAYKYAVNSDFPKCFSTKIAYKLIKSSFPMMLSTLLIAVYMKFDILLINYFLDERSVGIYSVGTRLVEAIYFFPIVIISSIFPTILKSKQRSEVDFFNTLQSTFTFMVWLGIIITFFFMLFNDHLISLLFGKQYEESSSILFIYSLVIVPLFLGVANDKWFYAEDKGYLLTFKIFLGAISNLILNLTLIPKFNLPGAALASVLSFYISVVLSDLFFKSLNRIFFLKLKAFFPIYLLKTYSTK